MTCCIHGLTIRKSAKPVNAKEPALIVPLAAVAGVGFGKAAYHEPPQTATTLISDEPPVEQTMGDVQGIDIIMFFGLFAVSVAALCIIGMVILLWMGAL